MNHASGGSPHRRGVPAGAPWAAACAAAITLTAAGSAVAQQRPATAQPTTRAPSGPVEVQGVVLELDRDDLVLDLGASAGATENLVAELWRPFRVKHPVTGKVLTDRFKIGQIQIGQVRPTMSLAKASGTLARPAAPGDLVIFTRTVVAPSAPASSSSATTSPATTRSTTTTTRQDDPAAAYDDPAAAEPVAHADVDARAVTEMFEALRGHPVHLRIARYEAFLRQHPDSRFAQVLLEEATALRQLLPGARPAGRAGNDGTTRDPYLASPPPKIEGLSGRPLRVAVEIRGAVRGVVLHHRRRGDMLFTSVAMDAAGPGYFAATIAADRITDRDLEYFVEAASDKGPVTVLGGPASPERIRVQTTPAMKPPPTGTGSVGILTDFADYNRLRGNDYAWQTEGTFSIRYKDLGIRAVRMGFGVYRGISGTVDELDVQEKEGRKVGLTYGHVETEIGIHKHFSLSARAVVGLLDDGIGGGGQLFARIGNDRGTNLSIGAELLGGVGVRGILQLELNTFERFPILLRSEVTNQPAGSSPGKNQLGGDDIPDPDIAAGQSEVAGRGIVQLGFRIVPELVIAVRGSFQGRNINHAGPGVGGFVGYTW